MINKIESDLKEFKAVPYKGYDGLDKFFDSNNEIGKRMIASISKFTGLSEEWI